MSQTIGHFPQSIQVGITLPLGCAEWKWNAFSVNKITQSIINSGRGIVGGTGEKRISSDQVGERHQPDPDLVHQFVRLDEGQPEMLELGQER